MGKKQWLLSAKVFTSVILIIFPICYAILTLLTNLPFPLLENSYIPIPSPLPIVVPPIPLLIVLLIFAIYPTIYSTPLFFKKRGFENVIIEYQFIKKILFLTIIIIIIFLSLFLILINQTNAITQAIIDNDNLLKNFNQQIEAKLATLNKTGKSPEEVSKELNEIIKTDDEFKTATENFEILMRQKLDSIFSFYQLISPIYDSIFFILPIPISIIVKLLIEHSRKLFKLYLAKACFRIVLNPSYDKIEKAKYFRHGLIWYNRFLKKIIQLQINNIDAICERVIIKSPLDNNKILVSKAKSFYSKDGFKPLRRIRASFIDTKEEITLIKEPLRTKIQESSDLLIPIITIIITIITTFFYRPSS